MATYKEIFGQAIKSISSDPTDTGAEGQIWYNDTSDTFKSVLATDAWSSTSPMNTARGHSGGVGIQTAALIACGDQPSVLPAATEEYNGSGWTSLTDGPQGRSKPFAAGITTAAVVGGGESGPDSGTTSIE